MFRRLSYKVGAFANASAEAFVKTPTGTFAVFIGQSLSIPIAPAEAFAKAPTQVVFGEVGEVEWLLVPKDIFYRREQRLQLRPSRKHQLLGNLHESSNSSFHENL